MKSMFDRDFADAIKVEFNAEWHNGTGYFDPICYDESLLKYFDNNFDKCFLATQDEKGRRLLINVTPIGNAVVFERYADNQNFFAVNVGRGLSYLGMITGPVDDRVYVTFEGLNDSIKELKEMLSKL